MDKKVTSIVAYIAPIGWLIAFLAGDKEGAKFHLNQALMVWILSILSGVVGTVCAFVPIVGSIISMVFGIAVLVFWILGLVAACKQEEKEIPIIGGIKILK